MGADRQHEHINRLRQAYESIEIPEGLGIMTRGAIKKARARSARAWATGIAAALVVGFAVGVNTVPSFAASIKSVPVVGSLARVFTLKTHSINDQERALVAEIETPVIEGLQNEELQSGLNEKYQAEARSMYEDFMAQVGELENGQLAHRAIEAGYSLKVNNGKLLTIETIKLEVGASGAESKRYDTVDLEKQVLLTLPMLFKDGADYVGVISENILEQMRTRMESGEGEVYFIMEDDIDPFERIKADQSFYINEDSKLVICFDEYEVAPGMMGTPSFEIPTEVIKEILMSGEYIK